MRDLRIEVAGQLLNDGVPFLSLDLVCQGRQNLVPFGNAAFGQLAQWHLLGVIADLFHLLVHHFQVKDQLYQLLSALIELTFNFALILISISILNGSILRFIILCDLDDLVVTLLRLVSELLVVFGDCSTLPHGPFHCILPGHTHPAPPVPHIEIVCI